MNTISALLKTLTEAPGVSGYEAPIRKIVEKELAGLGNLSVDKLGSVICAKKGSSADPKIMLSGHMDEIGFMVKYITDDGFIKFLPLGGWFSQVLLGQRVIIHTHKGDVVGVIGIKPPHLMSKEDRERIVTIKDMYIDIGAVNRQELDETGVRIGDPITPMADFQVMSNGKCYLSKAFDDRVGVALIVSTLKALQPIDHPNTVFGAATVLEETYLGGAQTCAEVIKPDVAIILESGIAGDVPGVKPEESPVKLGGGPNMLVYDSRMIPNLKLRDMVLDTAAELSIPVQLSSMEGGATDGGKIHLSGSGVPTVVIGVAARHIHSHSSIMHHQDYVWTAELVTALIKKMDKDTVAKLTQ